MKRYAQFDDLRVQQQEVVLQTSSEMPGIEEDVGRGTSALLAALYETGKIPDITTTIGEIQSYSWLWLYKSVYTICASLTCAESGFYAESLSLNRSLSESLVQILYLVRHPDEASKLPTLANGRKRKLSFFKMFEEIAPGYYQSDYALSSEFLHPGLGSNAFKMNRDARGHGYVDQGVVYKQDRMTHCFNELIMLILGFLRSVKYAFPTLVLLPATQVQIDKAIDDMQAVLDNHIQLKGGPNEWHRVSEPLWNPK